MSDKWIIEVEIPHSVHSGMKKILVIDDDASLCMLLEDILSSKYDVIAKLNVVDAFSWLSAGNSADLIVSDLRMPMIDGMELLEYINHSGMFRYIPVIIITGQEDSEIREKCCDAGAVAYFVKPFNPSRLLTSIDDLFVSKMFT